MRAADSLETPMPSALLRARIHGYYARCRYECTITQSHPGIFEVLEVVIEGHPPFIGTGRRFPTLDSAVEAGRALAHLLIDD
ncbi:hypothetical protein [Stenotrophomonas maltophilia]|uniref:hypothetical protein n=1 Tax=Stenotrophomonas maltophilia TaxID=40324 RepID=UPI0013DC9B16|nr:hypothetical protein [Stenotrophomonas maltophilia]